MRNVQSVEITPEQFEIQVKNWIRDSGEKLETFSSRHRKMINGDSGEYEIDVIAEFTIFNGAEIKILIECKRYKKPVERDVVMVLESKLRDSNAHKGVIFSTSGFQKGAIKYAQKRGIATILVQHGGTNYVTKSKINNKKLQHYSNDGYLAWFMSINDENQQQFSLIENDHLDSLVKWLSSINA